MGFGNKLLFCLIFIGLVVCFDGDCLFDLKQLVVGDEYIVCVVGGEIVFCKVCVVDCVCYDGILIFVVCYFDGVFCCFDVFEDGCGFVVVDGVQQVVMCYEDGLVELVVEGDCYCFLIMLKLGCVFL